MPIAISVRKVVRLEEEPSVDLTREWKCTKNVYIDKEVY